jgi:hypothetical protein
VTRRTGRKKLKWSGGSLVREVLRSARYQDIKIERKREREREREKAVRKKGGDFIRSVESPNWAKREVGNRLVKHAGHYTWGLESRCRFTVRFVTFV